MGKRGAQSNVVGLIDILLIFRFLLASRECEGKESGMGAGEESYFRGTIVTKPQYF